MTSEQKKFDAGRLVLIELGPPRSRTPLNFIREAEHALQRWMTGGDLQMGLGVAANVMVVAMQTVQRQGWIDEPSKIRAALLRFKRAATESSKRAQGAQVALIQHLLQATDDTLALLGDRDA